MHCPPSFPQIQKDLSVFPKVDLERNAHEIPQRFGQRQSLCHYTVKNNQVIYTVWVELLILFLSLCCDNILIKNVIHAYHESSFPSG